MIDLHDIRYVRLGTRDLEGATQYAQRILGLEVARRDRKSVYFKSDSRDHTLVYTEGDPAQQIVAFEVTTRAALDAAAAAIEAQRLEVRRGTASECEQRCVEDLVAFRDPSGNAIELVYRPLHSGIRYHGERDAGISGFSHIGLRTTDPVRDERFWTVVCSARVSDRIGNAALLRIDEVHHKIALFPSAFPGVQHINHQVGGIDDIMRSWYFLKAQGVRIVFGPGRHPTSSAMFLYFEGPDGMVYEYSSGVRLIAEDEEAGYVPRQFPFAPEGFCMWGSRPDIPEFRDRGEAKAAA
jgi:2,3-dihydroxy-p-cumate/2,3-dihydroxybenzoate 3,4-dioxygenase